MYQIKAGGGLNRMKFVFDGKQMEILETIAEWSQEETCSYGNDPYPHQKMELY